MNFNAAKVSIAAVRAIRAKYKTPSIKVFYCYHLNDHMATTMDTKLMLMYMMLRSPESTSNSAAVAMFAS